MNDLLDEQPAAPSGALDVRDRVVHLAIGSEPSEEGEGDALAIQAEAETREGLGRVATRDAEATLLVPAGERGAAPHAGPGGTVEVASLCLELVVVVARLVRDLGWLGAKSRSTEGCG